MTYQEYLENTCGLLSIPYWKAQKIITPKHMKIVQNKDFSEDLLKLFLAWLIIKQNQKLYTEDVDL